LEALSYGRGRRAGVGNLLYQFFYKELRVWLGYGSLVTLNFVEIVLAVATYFFLGNLMSSRPVAGFAAGYFPFVIVGIAFQHFVYEVFFATDQNTRREQVWGTVEAVMATPVTPVVYALGNYICYYFYTWLYVAIAFGFGAVFMGFHPVLNPGAVGSVLVISTLLVTSHLGLGLAAMGAILVSKAANPVATLFDWASRLLAGVYFPVAVLSPWLRVASGALPLTYALDALRQVLLNGLTLTSPAVVRDLIVLTGFTVVLFPLGAAVLNAGYRRALREGTLGQY
jgi:ABC-2 type transport system permease protein